MYEKFKNFLASIDKELYKNFLIGLDIALMLIVSILFWGYAFDETAEIPNLVAFIYVFVLPLMIAFIPIADIVFKKKFADKKEQSLIKNENKPIDSQKNKSATGNKKQSQTKKVVPRSKTEYYVNSEWFIAKCNHYDEQQAYEEIEKEKKEKERLEKYPPLKIIEFKPKRTTEQKDNTKLDITINEVLDIVDGMNTEGWKFEKFCADLLLHNGFVNAEVTSGSNDYGADIVAEDEHGIKFAIQCKCYSNKLDNSSIQEVLGSKQKYNCQVCAVITNNYFTNNAVELARVNNVSLWNRDTLIRFIKNAMAMADISNIVP